MTPTSSPSPCGSGERVGVRGCLLLSLLLLLPTPAQARKTPPPKKAKPPVAAKTPRQPKPVVVSTFGEVNSVTADAAYLNRGTADGLQPGQTLTFTRAGKPGGKCTVGAVSEHFSRCEGVGLKAGDRFAVGRVTEPSPVSPAPLPSDSELARRAMAVESNTWRLRDFDGASASSGAGTRVEALFSHTTYAGAPGGTFGVQRIDLLAYDVDVWKGLRVGADLTVLNFGAKPSSTRTIYQQSPVLLVRQLEIGFRRADVPFSAYLGRTWLRATSGLMVIDGAQAAWRFGEGFELGAYGGLLPEAARLTITPSQWAAGAFARARFSLGSGADATLVQLGLRGGWSLRDTLGGRAEIALNGSVWKGNTLDAQLAVELGFGQTQAVAGIDAARLDVGWRPTERLRLNGAVRYRGLPLTALTEVGTLSPGQRALHSDLGFAWELTPALYLGAQAGIASDFDSGLLQARIGPELSLPRVAGLPLSLSVGYLEEAGWVRGRHAYAQISVSASSYFRVITRANWFQQQLVTGNVGLAGHELGTTVALEVTPWRYVKGRVQFMGRAPLAAGAPPLGSVGFQLGGTF